MGNEYKNASWNICTQTLMHRQRTYTHTRTYVCSFTRRGRKIIRPVYTLPKSQSSINIQLDLVGRYVCFEL